MSAGFILSSFPAPPTHVPVPPVKYLPTAVLIGGDNSSPTVNCVNGDVLLDAIKGDVDVCTGTTNLTSYSPPFPLQLSSHATRIRSHSSSSSLVPPTTSFPVSPTFPLHSGVGFGSGLGAPPALPLPPLPAQPSQISPEHQTDFARTSYSSNTRNSRSLESVGSVGSIRSVKSARLQLQGGMSGKVDSLQSVQSLKSTRSDGGSAVIGRRGHNESGKGSGSDSSVTGTVIKKAGAPLAMGPRTASTNKRGRYVSSSSVSGYEESILDVELGYGSSDGDDDDQILIEKKEEDMSRSSNGSANWVVFPGSSIQTPLPLTDSSSNINPSFTTTSANSIYPNHPEISGFGSAPSPVQTRNRSRNGTLTFTPSQSRLKELEQAEEKGFKSLDLKDSNNNSAWPPSRVRTYSQPSSGSSSISKPDPHFNSPTQPIPFLHSNPTRLRAISSVLGLSSRKQSIPTVNNHVQGSLSSSASIPLLNSTTSSPTGRSRVWRPTIAMSTPPSSSSTPPSVNAIEHEQDHDLPTTLSSPTHMHLPSTPNPSSFANAEDDNDRSTSPDLQTLLSHTSEVLKSGGKVRSSSRSRSRSRVKSGDRMRTGSILSAGSNRSAGSGSGGSTGVPVPVPRPSRIHYSLHTLGSNKQQPQSPLRSDSKGSLVSKFSKDEIAIDSLPSRFNSDHNSEAFAGPSSRGSLMDESFEDDRDVFQEEGDHTERDREDDAFSFFNPSSSSHSHLIHGHGEDDPTLTLSFPVVEDADGEDIIDLKTPLPHILLRAGVLSPHSKLLPRKVGSSDEEDSGAGARGKSAKGRESPVDSLVSYGTTSSKHPRDARDTAKRRVRHKDGRLLRGGIGLTTGLGWSDSEDEDAPSEFTTRLKRLASMGGLSALSRKSSMASNMSGDTGPSSMIMSDASGYGSVYGGGGSSASINAHGYTPSISISQSSSVWRTSTYTTHTADSSSVSKRSSVYSEMSAGMGHNWRYANGTGGATANGATTPASRSSSRNVSRQSSFSGMPHHHSPHSRHIQKDFDIIDDADDSAATTSSKDKDRARKTASMVRVDELVSEQKQKDAERSLSTFSTISSSPTRSRSPSRRERERDSTISVSSISSAQSTQSVQSTRSTKSDTLTLNPPSISGSITPTPETPTTPTPMSSFGARDSSNILSPSPSFASGPLSSARQPIRMNTHLGGMVTAARSHSPVPPPSPAPTGPLPPTPGGNADLKVKSGRTGGFGVSTIGAPIMPTSMSMANLVLDPGLTSGIMPAVAAPSQLQLLPQSTTHNSTSPPLLTTSSSVPHPPVMSSTTLTRVTSPTPSFSMPTGSRTIHPARSRAGSLSSSRESGYSSTAGGTRDKTRGGSIGSIHSSGTSSVGSGEERQRMRLSYVVEDESVEREDRGIGRSTPDANGTTIAIVEQTIPSPIDPDAVAIVEMEPSEYGEGVAVVLTGDEDLTEITPVNTDSDATQPEDILLSSTQKMRGENRPSSTNVDIDAQSIPEYPYRFDMPPPSPVISAKGFNGKSLGFKRDDCSRTFQRSLATSSSSSFSSGLVKYSVSISTSATGSTSSSAPPVAFSPSPISAPPQHEHNASISSLETSESTASFFGAGRQSHMRMDSFNQNFSVFGSGMGVPPPDDVLSGRSKSSTPSTPTSLSTPEMSRNNRYHSAATAPVVSNSTASSSSSPPSVMSSLLSRATSPILARARATSPMSAISSIRAGSSLSFTSSPSSIPAPSSTSTPAGSSTRRPTTPSSQLGLISFSDQVRGTSPIPPSSSTPSSASSTTSDAIASKLPSVTHHHHHPPITPAPRKSSLPLPPSLFSSPGRPTSPPPPPSSAAGHMPSLLLRPAQGNGSTGPGGIPRKAGIPRPSLTPVSTSIPASSKFHPSLSSSSMSTSTRIASTPTASSIPSNSSSVAPHSTSMLPQPGVGRRVGTPVLRYGAPGIGSGMGKKGS